MSSERLKIKIWNYRNIPYSHPIEFEIGKEITFFVGVNNVGKSNLLKLFFEFRKLASIVSLSNHTVDVQFNGAYADKVINQSSSEKEIKLQFIKGNQGKEITIRNAYPDLHSDAYKVDFKSFDKLQTQELDEEIKRLFVGATHISSLRPIVGGTSAQSRDIQVGGNLIDAFDHWNTGHDVDKQKKVENLNDELRDLFGFKKFTLKADRDKGTLIVSNDDGYFRLDELGDGIGHFIVVLANVMFKQPDYIFIDEPEIGLHPKMQETFVRALASKARFGLVATTHSIGLARSVGDRIFSITRDEHSRLHVKPFGEHHPLTIAQSISELGYSQFVEIGGSNILLVEGRTEVKSYREILRHFGIENKFVIWPLGGTQFIVEDSSKIIDELQEVKRLNPKSVSVIFDSERTSGGQSLAPKLESFKKTCEQLSFRVFATDYHSTENYITQASIDKVVGAQYKVLTPFELFGSLNPSWDKNKNWLMFREMSKQDFNGTAFKNFIEGVLSPLAQS